MTTYRTNIYPIRNLGPSARAYIRCTAHGQPPDKCGKGVGRKRREAPPGFIHCTSCDQDVPEDRVPWRKNHANGQFYKDSWCYNCKNKQRDERRRRKREENSLG